MCGFQVIAYLRFQIVPRKNPLVGPDFVDNAFASQRAEMVNKLLYMWTIF